MAFLLLFAMLMFSSPAVAAQVECLTLPGGGFLEFSLPADWVFSPVPPDFLVRTTAADLGRELATKGETPEPARLEVLARRRLLENEGFVYQPSSKSYLLIDFSPLAAGAAPPDAATVAASARAAAEVLGQEDGVAAVTTDLRSIAFPGLTWAWRLDAGYRLDGAPRRFLGIIGFLRPCWVYLYFTDTGANGNDYMQMDTLLTGARILPNR